MAKYAFVIEPTGHAELSASSADRWMVCPGSLAVSAGIPNHASFAAAQGTAAHYIAAECQMDGGSPRRWLGGVAKVEGEDIDLDEDLLDAVQEFLDYIQANEQPGDVAFVEQSFTEAMRKLYPKFGGSSDRVMWRASEKLLRVYDYKHGAGIPVEVEDNRQMKYYALGALLANPQFGARTIEMVIAQPRCEHEAGRIRMASFAALELIEFAAELVEAAKATESFDAPLVPGKKQCQFCPAARSNKCPELEARREAASRAVFEVVEVLDATPDVAAYDKDKLAAALKMAPLLEAQISTMREFAYKEALRGVEVPGFKIVEKRATRKWVDPNKAKAVFADPKFYSQPELLSAPQVEKILGKKKFAEVSADLVEKKSSGFTLVEISDPREPALLTVSTVNDFQEEINGNPSQT